MSYISENSIELIKCFRMEGVFIDVLKYDFNNFFLKLL